MAADTPLYGLKLVIGKDQLPDYAEEIITTSIQELGGAVTTTLSEASIVLLNPAAAEYDTMRQKYEHCQEMSELDLILAPYHYLYAARNRGELFPINELKPAHPIFVHPETGHPLRVYVSVNIGGGEHDEPELKATEIQSRLQRRLEACGALIAETRRGCDVALFNLSPTMPTSKKFAKEAKALGKYVASRDWVESCIRSEKLKWTDGKDESGRRDESNSDAEEHTRAAPASGSKGPGRPFGTVRKEYTAEEDDLLCRWLARYKPGGSFRSRKTYEILVDSEAEYPWVTNHPPQSWHQRFKTNANAFERRIEAYYNAGIDDELKTKRERDRHTVYRTETKRARPREASDEQGPSKKARVVEKSAEKSSPKRPVAERVDTASPGLKKRVHSREPTPVLDPTPRARAGPGPSTTAASANRQGLAALSDEDNSAPALQNGSSTGQRPPNNEDTSPAAREIETPSEQVPAALDEDDAEMDAKLFPRDQISAPRQASPGLLSQRLPPLPSRSPPATEVDTQVGIETQAMLQHHQALRQAAVRQPSPVGEEPQHQHVTLGVNTHANRGRVSLSLSTSGNTTVDIDINDGPPRTPSPAATYIRQPGDIQRMLLGPEAKIEEINSSGGSRRQSSVRRSLQGQYKPDLVMKAAPSTKPSPVVPSSRLAAPVEPRPSTGTAEEGLRAMQEIKARYREWVASMTSKYGVSGRQVAETTARLRQQAAARHGDAGSLRWSEIELELQKLPKF